MGISDYVGYSRNLPLGGPNLQQSVFFSELARQGFLNTFAIQERAPVASLAPRPLRAPAEPGASIYIAGLPDYATHLTLYEMFGEFGAILSVKASHTC
jgi:hypothetical protein